MTGPARRNIGFTLIELMLVSAIIGLLAGIALPKFADLITKSREAALKGQLGTLRSALSIYYADNEGFFPRVKTLAPRFYGIYHLHGKYIDLNQLEFHLPRYAASSMISGKTSWESMDLYNPSSPYVFFFNTSSNNPIQPVPLPHPGNPIPSYTSWSNTFAGAVVAAEIGLWVPLLDTAGRPWSSW